MPRYSCGKQKNCRNVTMYVEAWHARSVNKKERRLLRTALNGYVSTSSSMMCYRPFGFDGLLPPRKTYARHPQLLAPHKKGSSRDEP